MNLFLAQACQNRFILADCLKEPCADLDIPIIHEALLRSDRDDALVLTEGLWQDVDLYLEMKVLAKDGSWAEFCGNGARACAAYLFTHYPHLNLAFLRTKKGVHRLAPYGSHEYSVQLPKPVFSSLFPFIQQPMLFQKEYGFLSVDSLEPHLVIQEKLSDIELLTLSQKMNARKDLFPYGINLNACHFLDADRLYVRTFERGVQRLTASCGTGALACAYAVGQGKHMEIITVGGPLAILFKEEEVELRGLAFVEGRW